MHCPPYQDRYSYLCKFSLTSSEVQSPKLSCDLVKSLNSKQLCLQTNVLHQYQLEVRFSFMLSPIVFVICSNFSHCAWLPLWYCIFQGLHSPPPTVSQLKLKTISWLYGCIILTFRCIYLGNCDFNSSLTTI